MVKETKDGPLKSFNFRGIRNKIPELKMLDCEIKTISFKKPIDSSNMTTKYWIRIVEIIENNYEQMDGFVIHTGTDTMS